MRKLNPGSILIRHKYIFYIMKTDLNDPKFNFVIAGGGLAGWLAALTIRYHYHKINVTVVESSEIGPVGVGESTTPQIIQFFDMLGISVVDLMKNTSATIKNGIKFTNWNGDGTHYYHGFSNSPELCYEKQTILNYSDIPLLVLQAISSGNNLNEVELSALASDEYKVKFAKSPFINPSANRIFHFTNHGNFALHFDSAEIISYLRKVGIERGINTIDSKIIGTKTNDDGYITHLELQGGNISVDFVIDATGFSRMIIGGLYQGSWKSYKPQLPLKKAIPFHLKNDPNRIPPYTECIAMENGWTWKIPLQDRFGCGYVFDSDRITENEAKDEIKKVFGDDIDLKKTLNFDPGAFTNPWIKNCVALGLASAFIEPLESTAIWITIESIKSFLSSIKGLTHLDELHRNRHNERVNQLADDVLLFVYLHYLGKRTDTNFWKEFSSTTEAPDFIKECDRRNRDITLIRPMISDFDVGFTFWSWEQVGSGIHFFNRDEGQKSLDSLLQGRRIFEYAKGYKNLTENLKTNLNNFVDHSEFIRYLKQI